MDRAGLSILGGGVRYGVCERVRMYHAEWDDYRSVSVVDFLSIEKIFDTHKRILITKCRFWPKNGVFNPRVSIFGFKNGVFDSKNRVFTLKIAFLILKVSFLTLKMTFLTLK